MHLRLFWSKKHTEKVYDITTEKGFESVYAQYWEKVFAICYNSTEDAELSENITQDLFKSLWERRNVLRIEQTIEGYLVRATKKKVAEHFRNQAIRKRHLEQKKLDYCDAADCTEQDVAFSCLVDELGLLVDQLPCQCRNVFKMSREVGLSNREIAAKLDISERAVEYHISKALGFLKQHLSAFAEPNT